MGGVIGSPGIRASGLRTGALLAAVAGLCIARAATPTRAAQPNFDDAPLLTGRDFAGLTFPIEAQPGDAILEARGGWAWADGDARRLLLESDVRVRLGGYDFRADRAVVWIEPRDTDAGRTWSLAMYFENLRTPLAAARFSQSARRLLVTANIAGDVLLRAALLEPGRPDSDPILAEGETRLATRLTQLIAEGLTPTPGTGFGELDRAFYEAAGAPAPLDPDAPIFPRRGVVTFDGPDRTLITGDTENALVITGGVVVEYADLEAGRTLLLTAQNAVVFLDPATVAETLSAGPGEVRGVYLEGNVIATDGDFTVRGPRVFYDVANDRAAMLDAVFYTFDDERRTPLYVRADVIRQESLGQWEAQRATISNVAFAEPHLSVGAKNVRVTRTRDAGDGGGARTVISARGVSLRLGDTPILPLPAIDGGFDRQTLPTVRIGTKDGDPFVSTRWDFASVFGLDADSPIEGDLLVDAFFARGPALGVDLAWETDDARGSLLAYGIYDAGEDRLTTGADLDPRREGRGLILGEHQWRLDERWTLALEGAIISDEAFVDAFFERIAETGPEVINRLAISRRGERSLLLAQTTGVFNDFTPNEFLLQSRGFQVQRLPEVSYWTIGDTFFGGRVTYFSESRAGILKPTFVEPAIRRFGFVSPALSQAAFGITPDQSLGDALRAGGFTESTIARLDTRHEVRGAFDVGVVRVTPFGVGRLTVYDDDFEDFRAAGGFDDDEQTRAWAGLGTTFSTSLTRVYNNVESSFFDLHRLRHIIEPSATVFTSTSNIDSEGLPVFDESVESLAEGTVFRVGLTSTLQTQRGGPGAWRNVDWLVLRAEFVTSSDDTTRESAIGRFFQSRPELSRLGEFVDADATLALTDAVGVVGSIIYDTENSALDSASVGALIDHGFGFASFAEIRRIDADVIDSTFLNFGASLELSARYAVGATASLDLAEGSFETLDLELRRRFAQWTLEVGVNFDNVRDDVGLAVQLRPWGGERDRLRNSLSRERFFAGGSARGVAGSPYRR